jgi:uncharacterized membrane protein
MCIHLYDASTTYVGIEEYNYGEQHVLTNFLMNVTGKNYAIFLTKLLLVPILVMIELEFKDDAINKNILKVVIFIIGFAPGTRNLLRMLLMV